MPTPPRLRPCQIAFNKCPNALFIIWPLYLISRGYRGEWWGSGWFLAHMNQRIKWALPILLRPLFLSVLVRSAFFVNFELKKFKFKLKNKIVNVECWNSNVERWMSNVECWIFRMSNVECWKSNVECRMSKVECWMSNVECLMFKLECQMICHRGINIQMIYITIFLLYNLGNISRVISYIINKI